VGRRSFAPRACHARRCYQCTRRCYQLRQEIICASRLPRSPLLSVHSPLLSVTAGDHLRLAPATLHALAVAISYDPFVSVTSDARASHTPHPSTRAYTTATQTTYQYPYASPHHTPRSHTITHLTRQTQHLYPYTPHQHTHTIHGYRRAAEALRRPPRSRARWKTPGFPGRKAPLGRT
jgi:hypothetical protein